AVIAAALISVLIYRSMDGSGSQANPLSGAPAFDAPYSSSNSRHLADRPGAPPGQPDNDALSGTVWPAHGQAAYIESGQSQIRVGPNQHAAPIASVTKVMTAYLVLRDHPLQPGEDGPTITLTTADVADTAHRRVLQQSIVTIAAGEELTE